MKPCSQVLFELDCTPQSSVLRSIGTFMSKALSSHALHSYLLKDGVTLNDVNDPDDGPNFLNNFPRPTRRS